MVSPCVSLRPQDFNSEANVLTEINNSINKINDFFIFLVLLMSRRLVVMTQSLSGFGCFHRSHVGMTAGCKKIVCGFKNQ